MSIFGKLYMDGEWHLGQGGTYQAIDPSTGKPLEPAMGKATKAQVEVAVAAAHRDSLAFAKMRAAQRALFLRECATQIEALGDELTTRITQETGYPKGRGEPVVTHIDTRQRDGAPIDQASCVLALGKR